LLPAQMECVVASSGDAPATAACGGGTMEDDLPASSAGAGAAESLSSVKTSGGSNLFRFGFSKR
jgi:hypothetical protein